MNTLQHRGDRSIFCLSTAWKYVNTLQHRGDRSIFCLSTTWKYVNSLQHERIDLYFV